MIPAASLAAPPPRPFEGLDGTTRMRRNVLVRQVDTAHSRIEAAIADDGVRQSVEDFALKSNRAARAKALSRLKSAFRAARLEWASIDKPALACWSYFKCRDASIWTTRDDHPRDRQKCVVTYFLLAGKLPNGDQLVTGRWSIEFSFHALARLCSPDRSPLGLTTIEAMYRAHDRILRSSVGFLFDHKQFLLEIEDGALLVEGEVGEIVGDQASQTLYLRANTWLAPHMAERCHAPPIPIGIDVSDLLAAYWLCPRPLRKHRDDGLVDVPAAMLAAIA